MRWIRRYRGKRRYQALQASMADARSGEVVFMSHCLLNQNTRYLGGAVCPGVVSAAIAPYVRDGTGIIQMACPEQRVWGGVLKTRMLWLIAHPRIARAARVLFPVVLRYVRWRYAHQAGAIVRDVEGCLASGLSVRGVVGVAGSPSCGVHTTLDLNHAAAALARRGRVPPTAAWMNMVSSAQRSGRDLASSSRRWRVPWGAATSRCRCSRSRCRATGILLPLAGLRHRRSPIGSR